MTTPVVLVVAYGAADLLRDCLAGLTGLDVLVVDNSSDPAVRGVCSGVTYVDAGSNLGFAGGVNRGLGLAPSGRDVLLLNPDALCTADQVADLATALAADASLAAVSPQIADPAGVPQRASWPWPTPGRLWGEAVGHPTASTDWLVGTCLLLRREALDAVGPFDERYFLYQEETDWQRRAVDAGWRLRMVDEVTVAHVGGGTSTDPRRREGQFHAAVETYIRRWHGSRGWSSYRTAAVVGALLRSAVARGEARRLARGRVGLYVRGPRRVALTNGWIPY